MTFPTRRAYAGAAFLVLSAAACVDQPTSPSRAALRSPNLSLAGDESAIGVSDYIANVNRRAAANGAGVAVARGELLITSNAPANTPRLIFANDRQLRLDTRWVPRDIRRLATDATLSYGVFTPFASATVGGPAEPAFDASFATWNNVSCSRLAVRKKAIPTDRLPSFILTGLFPPADINDVGFLPGSLFDLFLGPGASQFVAGVTWTIVFIEVGPNGQPVLDANGNPIPTDVDRDGRMDTAVKEVWFNDALAYSTTGAPGPVDIETAALHEHGHALELGHFGKIAGNLNTGTLQVSPRAVMNAILLGVLRSPLGSDNAALCGNFASWK